jgi:hypothetical protein
MATSRFLVTPPDLEPLPYGLLDTATVIDSSEPHWQAGVTYETYDCGVSNIAPDLCHTPLAATATAGGTTGVDTYPVTVDFTGNGDVTVDWGEGTPAVETSPASHDYTTAATQTITLTDEAGTEITLTVDSGSTDTTTVNSDTKTLTEGVPTVSGDPVGIYSLFGCRMVGQFASAQATAVTMLTRGEPRAFERYFWNTVLAGATDLSGASPASVTTGLAVLEDWAAQHYAGVPVIHATRRVGSLLASKAAIDRHGTHLESVLGSRIAAGGGYSLTGVGPDGSPAPTDTAWLYASGAVVIRRSTAIVQSAPELANPDNSFVALAERVYVPTVECFTAAIKVKNTD